MLVIEQVQKYTFQWDFQEKPSAFHEYHMVPVNFILPIEGDLMKI